MRKRAASSNHTASQDITEKNMIKDITRITLGKESVRRLESEAMLMIVLFLFCWFAEVHCMPRDQKDRN